MSFTDYIKLRVTVLLKASLFSPSLSPETYKSKYFALFLRAVHQPGVSLGQAKLSQSLFKTQRTHSRNSTVFQNVIAPGLWITLQFCENKNDVPQCYLSAQSQTI